LKARSEERRDYFLDKRKEPTLKKAGSLVPTIKPNKFQYF
jgi:hypothetical protein